MGTKKNRTAGNAVTYGLSDQMHQKLFPDSQPFII
jgi:hypothetical protein